MSRLWIILSLLVVNTSVLAQWDCIAETSTPSTGLWAVDVVTEDIVFAVGAWPNDTGSFSVSSGMILRTLDGGNSWDTTFIDTAGSFKSVHFPTPDTGYVTGGGALVYQTTNGGDTWTMQSTPAWGYTSSLKSIFFTDGLTGFATSGYSEHVTVKTTDGGVNWELDTSAFGGVQMCFPSDSFGINVGGAGGEVTRDGGGTWEFYSTGTSNMTFLDVEFCSDSIGFVGGIDQAVNGGAMARTIDGGITWSAQGISAIGQINAISVLSPTTAYAVGYTNGEDWQVFFKTTDGINWGAQELNECLNFPSLNDVDCANDSVCYAVGTRGQIYKTTNGGGPVSIVGLTEHEQLSSPNVYPNPVTTISTIDFDGKVGSRYVLEIYDTFGRKIREQTFTGGEVITVLRGPEAAGIYFFTIQDRHQGLVSTGKVILSD